MVSKPGQEPSTATEVIRYGRSGAALRLQETVVLPVAGDRWRPLPDVPGGALELVDKQGRPRGWVYCNKKWCLGADEDEEE